VISRHSHTSRSPRSAKEKFSTKANGSQPQTALERAQIAPLELEVKKVSRFSMERRRWGSRGACASSRGTTCSTADVAGAMTLEACKAPGRFRRAHSCSASTPGQVAVAAHLRELLQDSEIRSRIS
jgi:histidine ammonia-lyase